MPTYRISASRNGGTCHVEYAHDIRIKPGQRTLVTSLFPSDELVRDFGATPFQRYRVCLTCTASRLSELTRTGALHTIQGLRPQDLVDAGLLTDSDISAVNDDLDTLIADWEAVMESLRSVACSESAGELPRAAKSCAAPKNP